MKEKITWWIFVISAIFNIMFYGAWGAMKIWDLVKTINVDKTIILQIGLIMILIGSGFIYIKERITSLKKRRKEDRTKLADLKTVADKHTDDVAALNERLNQFDELQEDVKERCYTVAQLQKEIADARTERAKILSQNNAVYNGLSSNIDKLSERLEALQYKSSSEGKILGGRALSEEAIRQITGNIGELGDKK